MSKKEQRAIVHRMNAAIDLALADAEPQMQRLLDMATSGQDLRDALADLATTMFTRGVAYGYAEKDTFDEAADRSAGTDPNRP